MGAVRGMSADADHTKQIASRFALCVIPPYALLSLFATLLKTMVIKAKRDNAKPLI